ncbi:MAG: hypothetical protein GDA46_05820 [Bdellovibrionales bacterium]|nr:hypothetical protein [Bdellovibrionales bacterium]
MVIFKSFDYKKLSENIKDSVSNTIENMNLNIAKRVKGSLTIKNIDKYNTKLRLRNFWGVKNPLILFDKYQDKKLVVILTKDRFKKNTIEILKVMVFFNKEDYGGVFLWK